MEPAATKPPAAPILAQAIAPRPFEFRFSLRALMWTMVACSVQFAALSYLGMVQGLLVGAAVIFALMMTLLLGGVIFLRRDSAAVDRMLLRLVIALLLVCFSALIAGSGGLLASSYGEAAIAWQVERNLGFTTSRVQIAGDPPRGLQVRGVTSGGGADRAGLRPGDFILVTGDYREFYRALGDGSLTSIDFAVVRGADPTLTDLKKCPPPLTITVPLVAPGKVEARLER